MIIFPAIDIKDKECVRLYKGDFATAGKDVYGFSFDIEPATPAAE